MQIGNSTAATQAALTSVQGSDDKRAALQMMILKKALDAQKMQAEQVTNVLLGKGQVVDIRI